MMDSMLGRQLYDSLTVDLLKDFFTSEFPKCLLINVKNFDPMFVFTFLLYGGLNQIMFLVRFIFFFPADVGSVYITSFLYPAAYNASLYTGASLSKTSLLHERLDIR